MSDLNNPIELRKKRRIEELAQFEKWSRTYPDFNRIAVIMEDFITNELLIAYLKHSPPDLIHDKAIEIYKKCISFKVKLTKKVLSPLLDDPKQLDVWCYYVDYCINKDVVKAFLKSYQIWNKNIHDLWRETYYLNQDYFYNTGYDSSGWKFYIDHPQSLKAKAERVEKLHEKLMILFIEGKALLNRLDQEITLEYQTNAIEMSMFERELEIINNYKSDDYSDEEYCYVYTLECDLFVFYVGIASNPRERFDQHLRGAFSDESHLFKSKFIQKYHNQIRQKIIFEGTRRECKKQEKDFIKLHTPLGNMTEGGEG